MFFFRNKPGLRCNGPDWFCQLLGSWFCRGLGSAPPVWFMRRWQVPEAVVAPPEAVTSPPPTPPKEALDASPAQEAAIALSEEWGRRRDGCSIDLAEMRGMSLAQLREVRAYVEKNCMRQGWTSTNPAKHGELLTPETVTLYDLNHYFIMPATKKKKSAARTSSSWRRGHRSRSGL